MSKKKYTDQQLRRRYWIFGGLGMGALGFGLSALVESGFLKHGDAESWQWIMAGTVSLVLIMMGINFLFESFSCKIQLKQ
ncbi:hypothetical protein AAU57_11515 [Nonlabens sp. YIK11]|uniref:hypothetical protein n=1 Tax=Nonlabens sp. YIK11 TaxID=1453349 RepID=UPI0006DCC0EB|nr:hypothetical protein [Nonlabens sp. YIK11]KQC33887.1 hypothetical protein AAU57_11515 [Nonlabens sp. YIK11]